jgi:hypothetical protein
MILSISWRNEIGDYHDPIFTGAIWRPVRSAAGSTAGVAVEPFG